MAKPIRPLTPVPSGHRPDPALATTLPATATIATVLTAVLGSGQGLKSSQFATASQHHLAQLLQA